MGTSSTQKQAPRDYTHRFRSSSSGGSGGRSTSSNTISSGGHGPDRIVNHPPIILFGLGGFGFGMGLLTNLWQVFTTFIALWAMFNVGNNSPNWNAFWGRQPAISAVCILIATCAQYFLQLLVFKIDHGWKNEKSGGKSSGQAMLGSVVHIVQQAELVTILSVLAFIVDTVGDFTFISLYTTSMFIIFAYAASLYAFSTLGFVRGIEYLWAGWAAVYRKGK